MNCEIVINIILGVIIVLLSIKLIINLFSGSKTTSSGSTKTSEQMTNEPTYTVYHSPHCGYCKKLMDEIEKGNFTNLCNFVDITTPSGKKQFGELGEAGVPVVINSKNQKKAVGYKPISKIIEELK
jgi:protein-disulfide isomerase